MSSQEATQNGVKHMIRAMLRFQREQQIKGQCVTNCQYLHDTLKAAGMDSRVKAVYVVGFRPDDKRNVRVWGGHVVVECEGIIFEPSYEIASLHDVSYYDNITDWSEEYKDNILKQYPTKMKKMITEHIEFCRYANSINHDNMFAVDDDYYHSQADYVERQMLLQKMKSMMDRKRKR